MITSEGVFKDYDEIVKENCSPEEKLVKVQKIILKLLVSIRTNQMGGIKKVRPEEKK
jgi:hypothetical protein